MSLIKTPSPDGRLALVFSFSRAFFFASNKAALGLRASSCLTIPRVCIFAFCAPRRVTTGELCNQTWIKFCDKIIRQKAFTAFIYHFDLFNDPKILLFNKKCTHRFVIKKIQRMISCVSAI